MALFEIITKIQMTLTIDLKFLTLTMMDLFWVSYCCKAPEACWRTWRVPWAAAGPPRAQTALTYSSQQVEIKHKHTAPRTINNDVESHSDTGLDIELFILISNKLIVFDITFNHKIQYWPVLLLFFSLLLPWWSINKLFRSLVIYHQRVSYSRKSLWWNCLI